MVSATEEGSGTELGVGVGGGEDGIPSGTGRCKTIGKRKLGNVKETTGRSEIFADM